MTETYLFLIQTVTLFWRASQSVRSCQSCFGLFSSRQTTVGSDTENQQVTHSIYLKAFKLLYDW